MDEDFNEESYDKLEKLKVNPDMEKIQEALEKYNYNHQKKEKKELNEFRLKKLLLALPCGLTELVLWHL